MPRWIKAMFSITCLLATDQSEALSKYIPVYQENIMLTTKALNMTVTMDRTTYKIGDDPILSVKIENVTDDTVSVFRNERTHAYKLTVTGPDGKILTPLIADDSPSYVLHLKSREYLRPHSFYMDQYHLKRLYVFSFRGSYKLHVEMDVYPKNPTGDEKPIGTLDGTVSFEMK